MMSATVKLQLAERGAPSAQKSICPFPKEKKTEADGHDPLPQQKMSVVPIHQHLVRLTVYLDETLWETWSFQQTSLS